MKAPWWVKFSQCYVHGTVGYINVRAHLAVCKENSANAQWLANMLGWPPYPIAEIRR